MFTAIKQIQIHFDAQVIILWSYYTNIYVT